MFTPPLACDILDNPVLVAPLPYINFLRYFKRIHPKYGVRRLLQEAPAQWDAMTRGQQNLFQKKRILARIARSPQVQLCRVLHRRQCTSITKLMRMSPEYKRRHRRKHK